MIMACMHCNVNVHSSLLNLAINVSLRVRNRKLGNASTVNSKAVILIMVHKNKTVFD